MIRLGIFVLMIFSILILSVGDDALAATKKKKPSNPADNPRYAALVMDAQTGEILMARNADSLRHPASLTKMMTLYMLFEAIEQGRMTMSDRIPISSHAAGMPPSKIGLPAGSSIRVDDAVKSLVTESANDISAAIGEKLGGSEKRFASLMTSRAHKLGMTRTTFRNASGLPDPQQVTTARDMARLGQALLKDFPQHYSYFGIKNFEYRGRNHGNHNRLLGNYPGLDGIKTGYINASGFNLVASAKQNGRRLIGVVFGGRSWKSRNDHMVKLLDQGFVEIGKRKTMVQEASLTPSAPVPLPPPMMDDIRGVASMALSEDNATDEAEDMPATEATAATAARAAATSGAPIAQITFEPIPPADLNPNPAGITPPSPVGEQTLKEASLQPRAPVVEQAVSAAVSASGVPIPPQRPVTLKTAAAPSPAPAAAAPVTRTASLAMPAASIQMAPVGKGAQVAAKPSAPTVMQLTLKRDQLPAGFKVQTASNHSNGWAVQVGAFHSRAMTDQALRTAQSRLPTHLQHAQPVIVPQNTGGAIVFRGRLQGFDEVQANAACQHLGACLVVAPGS